MNSEETERNERHERARAIAAALKSKEEAFRRNAEAGAAGVKTLKLLERVVYQPCYPPHVDLIASAEWSDQITDLGRAWKEWIGSGAEKCEPYIHEKFLGVEAGAAVFRAARARKATASSVRRAIAAERQALKEIPVRLGDQWNLDSEWGIWSYFREMIPHLVLETTVDGTHTMSYSATRWSNPILKKKPNVGASEQTKGRFAFLDRGWPSWTPRAQRVLEACASDPHSHTAKEIARKVSAMSDDKVSDDTIKDLLTEMKKRGLLRASSGGFFFGRWPSETPAAIKGRYPDAGG